LNVNDLTASSEQPGEHDSDFSCRVFESTRERFESYRDPGHNPPEPAPAASL